jgi:hypothetical protein
MRKLILTICVAVALLGCTKEPNPVAPSVPGAISFDSVDTRADAGLANIQANGFGVWAFMTNTAQTNYPLMSNRHVTYAGEVLGWSYEPLEYWVDNTVYSFVAVYPYAENPTNIAVENGVVKLSVAETPSDTDWLVAKNGADTSVEGFNTTVPVSLEFQHVLTSVGLKIWRDGGKHQNDQMRITKVTLSGMHKAGSLSCDSDTWTYTTDKLTKEYTNSNLSDSDNIGAYTVNENGTITTGGTPCEPFGDMMLLPQTINDSNVVSLKIEYELKLYGAPTWTKEELEAVLPAKTWNAGSRYTYNVVLSRVTDITVYYILTKVDQWGTPQVGGTVIIK